MGQVQVEPMTTADWPQVAAIYRTGIGTGQATFETEPPTWSAFDAAKLAAPRLVARVGDVVIGWVAVAAVSSRSVYAGVVEHSVFVHPDQQGQGVGGLLLDALITQTEAGGIWTIQAQVFPENTASLRLHARRGFRQVGVRQRLGQMSRGPLAGTWRDVILIERRSTSTGR